jgi:hypothetical protein
VPPGGSISATTFRFPRANCDLNTVGNGGNGTNAEHSHSYSFMSDSLVTSVCSSSGERSALLPPSLNKAIKHEQHLRDRICHTMRARLELPAATRNSRPNPYLGGFAALELSPPLDITAICPSENFVFKPECFIELPATAHDLGKGQIVEARSSSGGTPLEGRHLGVDGD